MWLKTDDPSKGVTQAAMKRWCRKGEVTRISGAIYPFLRRMFTNYNRSVLRAALCSMRTGKRTTIIPKDIVFALSQHGRLILGADI